MKEINPRYIILLLRNKVVDDWESICESIGIDPNEESTLHGILLQKLFILRGVGLISFKGKENYHKKIKGKIKLSAKWNKLQSALEISLTSLSLFSSNDSIIVKPHLGIPHSLQSVIDIFVLMPFKYEFRPVYENHITKVANSLNLNVMRADNIFSVQSIISDIWAAICSSKIIVADCTDKNPNVYYEIGLAHSVGKKVILITQNESDVPFDLKHLRYIKYDLTKNGMEIFKENLKKVISNTLTDLYNVSESISEPEFQHSRLAKVAIVRDLDGKGWTKCPWCQITFSIKHDLYWDGSGFSHYCGGKLILKTINQS